VLLAAALAIVLAQETVPTAPSDIAPEPPPPPAHAAPPPPSPAPRTAAPPGDPDAAPPLPEGPLLPVAKSDRGETFLVVNRFSRSGVMADFWTYDAFSAPIEVAPGVDVVQGLARRQIDCEKQTDQTFASAGYDESGKAVVALAAGPPTPLADDSVGKLVAEAVCKGDTLPKEGQILGHAAALVAARAPAPG
jgi:hypothetical protein